MIIRAAREGDHEVIRDLIRELAETLSESSEVTSATVKEFLDAPGSGALVAEDEGRVIGVLTYTVRPNLYHAAQTCLIEELVVADDARDRGAGGRLVEALLESMQSRGCAEVSVTVLSDNAAALRFYRSHGLTDEAVLLERHL